MTGGGQHSHQPQLSLANLAPLPIQNDTDAVAAHPSAEAKVAALVEETQSPTSQILPSSTSPSAAAAAANAFGDDEWTCHPVSALVRAQAIRSLHKEWAMTRDVYICDVRCLICDV